MPTNVETTAMGAAYLAGLATGVWRGPEDLPLHRPGETVFTPAMPPDARQTLRDAWQHALRQTRTR